jgi:uncharacterized protein with HEPN domain
MTRPRDDLVFLSHVRESIDRISAYLDGVGEDIAGMRDKLVHDYMGVDLSAVWDTATRDIPNLAAELDRLMVRLRQG